MQRTRNRKRNVYCKPIVLLSLQADEREGENAKGVLSSGSGGGMTPWISQTGNVIDERIEWLDHQIEVKEIQIQKHREERERLMAIKEKKN